MYFRQFFAVFKNSFKICLADPFFIVVILSMIGMMGLASSMPSIGEEQLRLLRDQTHAILFICGAVAVAFGLVRVMTDDIRRGAGSVLMSRPVSGGILVVGKFAGVMASLSVLFVIGGMVITWFSEIFHEQELVNVKSLIFFLLAILAGLLFGVARQYLFGSNFSQFGVIFLAFFITIGVLFRYFTGKPEEFDMIGWQSIILLYLALVTFAAVIMVVAVLMDSAMVIGVAVFVFFLGLVVEYLCTELIGGMAGDVLSVLLPNWQLFWILEKIGTNEVISGGFFWMSSLHALIFSLVYLTIATIFFEKIEIKGVV